MTDYKFKKVGKKYIVCIPRGGKIVSSLQEICEKEDIKTASITGIGAVNEVTFAFLNLKTMERDEKTFEGLHEIVSLVGNVSILNNKPFLHLHLAVSGSDFNVIGGHLIEGTIYTTSEIVIDVADGTVEKKPNPSLAGFPTLDL